MLLGPGPCVLLVHGPCMGPTDTLSSRFIALSSQCDGHSAVQGSWAARCTTSRGLLGEPRQQAATAVAANILQTSARM